MDSPSPQPEDDPDHCTICLQSFLDRTILPTCAHEFCFECILVWSDQSRNCPLCARSFDGYLIHHVRSPYDYQKHHLPPLRVSSPRPAGSSASALRAARRERQWGRRQRRAREEADQLERAIARRRWVYQHHLYAKHVASNPYTRYRPFPTPAQFAASPDLVRRMTTFLRRELRVWPDLDVEFLTTVTLSLMKSIDIRSETAVKLLSEFLDLDAPYTAGKRHVHAEHFAHEIYSYLRSPYRDLDTYDQTVQYDTPPEPGPPGDVERSDRWRAESSTSRRSRSRSHSRRGRERDATRSPHGSESEDGHTRPRGRGQDVAALQRSPDEATVAPRDEDPAAAPPPDARVQGGDVVDRASSNARRKRHVARRTLSESVRAHLERSRSVPTPGAIGSNGVQATRVDLGCPVKESHGRDGGGARHEGAISVANGSPGRVQWSVASTVA